MLAFLPYKGECEREARRAQQEQQEQQPSAAGPLLLNPSSPYNDSPGRVSTRDRGQPPLPRAHSSSAVSSVVVVVVVVRIIASSDARY